MIGLHFSGIGPLAFFFSKCSLIALLTPKTGYDFFASQQKFQPQVHQYNILALNAYLIFQEVYCSGGRHFTEELWALLCPPSLLPLSIFKFKTIQPYTQKCWIHQMSWTPMVSLRSCLHVMSMKKTNSRPSEKWFFFACCLTSNPNGSRQKWLLFVPDKNNFCTVVFNFV